LNSEWFAGAASESHIVKLSDGSVWQIVSGDIDLTLAWLPGASARARLNDLFLLGSHFLIRGNATDPAVVRRLCGHALAHRADGLLAHWGLLS
jgi:hypothetical protein